MVRNQASAAFTLAKMLAKPAGSLTARSARTLLSISIWAFFENANWGAASALSVIATIVTVGMMALVMRAPLRL